MEENSSRPAWGPASLPRGVTCSPSSWCVSPAPAGRSSPPGQSPGHAEPCNKAWFRFFFMGMATPIAYWILPHSSWGSFHPSWKRAQLLPRWFCIFKGAAGCSHASLWLMCGKRGPCPPETHHLSGNGSPERGRLTGWWTAASTSVE